MSVYVTHFAVVPQQQATVARMSPPVRVTRFAVGVPGPQGPPGISSDSAFAYVHDQPVASATWTINHGLGGYPNVTLVENDGTVFQSNLDYVDFNTIVATHAVMVSGKAYLS